MDIKLIPEELLLEIYKDLAKPGVQQVGQAIGGILSIVNLAALPFRYLSDRGNIVFERNINKYREKMALVAPENITEAIPEIAAPILERMTYTSCEELADMFANLLKNASTNEGSKKAHPNFVNIISSISRDEAIILEDLHKGVKIPSLRVKQTFDSGLYRTPVIIFTHYYNDVRLHFPTLDQFYHTNLTNVGLLYDHGGELSDGTYEKLNEEIKPLVKTIRTPDTIKFNIQNEHLGLTAIGKLFLESVFD